MRVIALYEHLRLCQVAVYIWVFVSAGRSAVRSVPSAVQRPWLNWPLRRGVAPVSSQPRHRRCRHRATTDPLHSQPRSPPSRHFFFVPPPLPAHACLSSCSTLFPFYFSMHLLCWRQGQLQAFWWPDTVFLRVSVGIARGLLPWFSPNGATAMYRDTLPYNKSIVSRTSPGFRILSHAICLCLSLIILLFPVTQAKQH